MNNAGAAQDDSDCFVHWIRQRYGDRLTPAELEEVKQGVAGIIAAAAALRKVELDNRDEPFSLFVPYRGED